MRDRIILVKGNSKLATQITIAPFERIAADHVVLIVALKHPQCLPEGYYDGQSINPNYVLDHAAEIVRQWTGTETEHFVSAEYAGVVLDYGRSDVKAVEGESLLVPWFYETLRVLHRNLGQIIVEVETMPDSDDLFVDGVKFSRVDALDKLKPAAWLG